MGVMLGTGVGRENTVMGALIETGILLHRLPPFFPAGIEEDTIDVLSPDPRILAV